MSGGDDERHATRQLKRNGLLVWLSFGAWAAGVTVLALTIWEDANVSGPGGDVALGLAAAGFIIGLGAFLVLASLGTVLGVLARRRPPVHQFANIAVGLNVVTLVGVLLGFMVRLAR